MLDAHDDMHRARSLDDLYGDLAANRFTAGWYKKWPSLYPEPRADYTPQHWRRCSRQLLRSTMSVANRTAQGAACFAFHQ